MSVYRHCQLESFVAEINCLKEGFPLKKGDLFALAPSLDNGFIRVWGRISRAFVSYGQRHQVIILGK